MLKKISVSDLSIGMYIDKFDGNWLKHPFWKASFKLESSKDLNSIKNSEVSHLWIDTSKGDDVISTPPENTKDTAEKATTPAPAKAKPATVSLEKEMLNAQQTLTKAKQAVTDMFKQARMGNTISTEDVSPLVDEISESINRNPAAIICITRIKNKDDYTYLHSVAVCALMIALGKQLNYTGDMHALGMAGLLHDVGKMFIPEDILNKPGKLTDEEFETVKNHPLKGWEALKESGEESEAVLDVCLHHHERVDGKGYPENLSGDNLSLLARMGAVCDVYDAITSDRSYKKGWEPADALKKMAEWQTGHFDDKVFKAFVKAIGIYPSGTLVKLKSGRLGIVTEQSDKSLLKPKIKIFFSTSSNTPIPTKTIDLGRSQESIASIEDPENWGFDRQHLIDIISQ
ncbi:MAG: HD-GYP domain-containing protein [Gammaproteobacteria bacterium]|nr:HD-GYP domain-containing protein [Gammaproteobacteria bacterium]